MVEQKFREFGNRIATQPASQFQEYLQCWGHPENIQGTF